MRYPRSFQIQEVGILCRDHHRRRTVDGRDPHSVGAEITTDVASKLYEVAPIVNDQSVNGEPGEGLKLKREKGASVPGATSE